MNMQKFELFSFCFGLVLFFSQAAMGGDVNSLFEVSLNQQIEIADVIVTARLVPASPPFKNHRMDLYQLEAAEVIAGKIETNSFIFVRTAGDSGAGVPVESEKDMSYLLFLKKIDLTAEGLPKGITTYSLLYETWQSFLPLSLNAKEKRFHRYLKDMNAFDASSLPLVVKAVKASVDGLIDSNVNGEKNKQIEDEVRDIIQKLGLKNHKRESPEDGGNSGT